MLVLELQPRGISLMCKLTLLLHILRISLMMEMMLIVMVFKFKVAQMMRAVQLII